MISFGTDPAYSRSYVEYYAARNVFWDRIVARSFAGVLTNRMIMTKDETRRSEFYNDYLRPQEGDEILCALAARQGCVGTCFTLWRAERRGPWQNSDMTRLAALTPHLQRAVRLNERIGAFHVVSGLAAELLYRLDDAVLLVDAGAAITFANRAAEDLLAGDTLRLESNSVRTQRASDNDRLHRLITAAAQDGRGGSLALPRKDRPPLIVWVIPLRPESHEFGRERGVLLLIRDLERPAGRSLRAFADHFGLTSAEEGVAVELIKGDGVNAAASRLALSPSTVRTHLIRIFQKTGTGRQAELVRFMLEWTDGLQLSCER
jgi:DNA-binding CsgD family transcriptional regulator/PAS domain-containing protein